MKTGFLLLETNARLVESISGDDRQVYSSDFDWFDFTPTDDCSWVAYNVLFDEDWTDIFTIKSIYELRYVNWHYYNRD